MGTFQLETHPPRSISLKTRGPPQSRNEKHPVETVVYFSTILGDLPKPFAPHSRRCQRTESADRGMDAQPYAVLSRPPPVSAISRAWHASALASPTFSGVRDRPTIRALPIYRHLFHILYGCSIRDAGAKAKSKSSRLGTPLALADPGSPWLAHGPLRIVILRQKQLVDSFDAASAKSIDRLQYRQNHRHTADGPDRFR